MHPTMTARITFTALLAGILPVMAAAQYDAAPSSPQASFRWPEGVKMAISLSFDDARLSQIDRGMELFGKYGVKATFYVSPEPLDERIDGWKSALAAGHEIGNHSMTHPCTGNFDWSRHKALENMTLHDMGHNLAEASRLIHDRLGIWPRSFAYPCGQTFVGRGTDLRSYIPLVAAQFESGRAFLSESWNDPLFCDPAQLAAMDGDGKEFSDLQPIIENAAKSGGWLVLAGHEIGEGGFQTTRVAMLEALFRYAANPANGVWLAPVSEVAAYVRVHRTAAASGRPLYLDASQPVEARVEDLLGRMTLAEKIGQINMPVLYSRELGGSIEEKKAGSRSFTLGTFEEGIGPGGGFFTMANHILVNGPAGQVAFFNELQQLAFEQTRLKIPLLQVEEGTHGLMCSGGTIFPEGHGLGSTWNLGLIDRVYAAAAREARSVGIHALYTLVVEPNRDPRLGRNIEGYGEDPYLCARFAETITRAVQGASIAADDKVIAGLCHYPGQSQPVGGIERGDMEISERLLREVFLPPWESGIAKAGALGVMATYPAIDGVPVHSSPEIMTDMLRGELGFRGIVLSEGNGVNTLNYNRQASDFREAGAMALNAGMDVSISFDQGFLGDMLTSVRDGQVSEATIDRSVRRVLDLKFRLGLFENPYVQVQKAEATVHNPEHVDLALEAARESIVLLKNENNLLPLSEKVRSIALIGPNADHARNQLGDYTSRVVLQEVVTVLGGIRDLAKNARVEYVQGCEVVGTEVNQIREAARAARRAEVAVVVLGENEWQAEDGKGTTGEGYDVATLELTGLQLELVKAVAATGTPTIVVLIAGRPLAIPWIAENVPAVVHAWLPGERGGAAVAEVLFGRVNPSGKLTATMPRHAGQFPFYYDYKHSKQYWLEEGWGNSYADIDWRPLYEFGHGLSYTAFAYANLNIGPEKTGTQGSVRVRMEVRNTGARAGMETVQLYVRDLKSSVVTPVKMLKGFEKVHLEPGEARTVEFRLGPEHLSLYDRNMNRVVEPGDFEVMVGSSSEKIHLRGAFTLLGP
jgi:beta-glucosidase